MQEIYTKFGYGHVCRYKFWLNDGPKFINFRILCIFISDVFASLNTNVVPMFLFSPSTVVWHWSPLWFQRKFVRLLFGLVYKIDNFSEPQQSSSLLLVPESIGWCIVRLYLTEMLVDGSLVSYRSGFGHCLSNVVWLFVV